MKPFCKKCSFPLKDPHDKCNGYTDDGATIVVVKPNSGSDKESFREQTFSTYFLTLSISFIIHTSFSDGVTVNSYDSW